MPKARVIGLTAPAGSGKDTVFDIIDELMDSKTVVRVAFGDAVKEEVAEQHGVSVEEVEENKEAFRNALQQWGTEHRRKKDPRYWIKQVETEVKMLRDNADLVVITDVRFLNEAEYIKSLGGDIIKIVPSSSHKLIKEYEHASETESSYISPDWLLPNSGSLKQLAESVAFLLQDMEVEDFSNE